MDTRDKGRRSARITSALVSLGGLVVAMATGAGLWFGHEQAGTTQSTPPSSTRGSSSSGDASTDSGSSASSSDSGSTSGSSTDSGSSSTDSGSSSTDSGITQGSGGTGSSDATTTGS
jgi:cytoskeletal protein RodZ